MAQVRGVLFDVDGTLVNSNDAQARSWVEAMNENGRHVAFEQVRPLIGMGGDKVLPKVLGIAKDSEEGKRIDQRRGQIFKERYLPHIQAFPGTKELLQRIHDSGLTMGIATSAKPDELQSLLKVVGPDVPQLFQQEASAKDTSQSKPDPNIMEVALQRIGCQPEEVIMIGDTSYDIEAAAKAKIKTIAFRCGGSSDKDLAGAIAIYNDPADLLAHYDESPLAPRSVRTGQ